MKVEEIILKDSIETNKIKRYVKLVSSRKICKLCDRFTKIHNGQKIYLENPSLIDGGIWDSEHIGPWSAWQGSLNAKIMIIGKDFGPSKYFKDNKGKDSSHNKTNKILVDSLNRIGINVESVPSNMKNELLFFTNSILCMHSGKDKSIGDLKREWIRNCTENYLYELIDIINPKIIISLGKDAFKALAHIFDLYEQLPKNLVHNLKIKEIIERGKPFKTQNGILIFAVAHPAYAKRTRPEPLNSNDWTLIKKYIDNL